VEVAEGNVAESDDDEVSDEWAVLVEPGDALSVVKEA
jgi:hypothetical protein